MAPTRLAQKIVDQAWGAVDAADGNVSAAADALGLRRSTLASRLKKYPRRKGAAPPPQMEEAAHKVFAEPARTRVVLMTAVQDDTPLAQGALENLQAYAAHRGGEVMIGGFTYQKGLFEDHSVASGVFAQKVIPLLKPEVVELAPHLVWYGSANILPTAVDPLTGWETNTRDKWAIFPHAKIALKCVPTLLGKHNKQIMTTGVITKPNYIQRNAGQKAEFHHTPGATIAEIKADGTFFCRQIGIARDGSFQDLDIVVKDQTISVGNRVESITWGDIHFEELDQDIARVLWGWDYRNTDRFQTSMLDVLEPRTQFFHDSYSFKARGHHTINDPHERAQRVAERQDSVHEMLKGTAGFLANTKRPWCRSVHVASNHNSHLDRWLKDPQGHFDAANARIWHQLNLAWFDAIDDGEGETFSPSEHALRAGGEDLGDITFLHGGQSYVICQDTAPIECGIHGDVGPRGSRGSPTGLAKLVERVTSAHTHEPKILDGVYVAGTSSRLDIKYATKGASAWQHAEVVTYPTGRRTIVTLSNGQYRA